MSRSKSEIIRRLRLGNLRSLLRARCGHTLPDDDAGREYLWELLLPVSLAPEEHERKMANAIQTWAPWMKMEEATEMSDQIKRLRFYPRTSTPREIGKRLRVTREEWVRLKLKTILPFDMTDEEIAEFRKAKKRARDLRRRRAAGSKPHAGSLARLKPWKAESISHATWFRKQSKEHETNSRQEQECSGETNSRRIKLLNSRALSSLTEKTERPKEGLAIGNEGEGSRESTESAESVERAEKRARALGS